MPILSDNSNMYAGYTLLCYALSEDLVASIFSCLTGVEGYLQHQRKSLHDKYAFDNDNDYDSDNNYDFDDWSDFTDYYDDYYYFNLGCKYFEEDEYKLTYDTLQLTDLYYLEKDSKIQKYNKR